MGANIDDNVSVARAHDAADAAQDAPEVVADGAGQAEARVAAGKGSGGGLVGRLTGRVSSFAGAVKGRLVRALPTRASRTVAAVACACVVATGTAAIVGSMGASGVDETVLWVDDDEPCVNFIQEAAAKLGQGENQIDEVWNGHAVGIYATREFDLRTDGAPTGMTSPYTFPAGCAQRAVQDAWAAAGGIHDEQGFCKLNDCYLIACTSVFGEVGDKITFYFNDGSSIDCIKVDAKAETVEWYDPTPATKWGHDDGKCVLEFCGEDRIGDEPYQTLGKVGLHTTSWTNHGKAVDPGSSMGGSIGGASSSSASISSGVAASAIEECKAKTNFDNSTLAASLVSYSYSQREVYDGSQWEGTKLYLQVWGGVYPGDGYPRSCDRSVASAIKWSGADDDFPAGACPTQLMYCYEHPELWEHLGDFQASAGGATAASEAEGWGLQPGDILICDDHTMAYVGMEAVQEGYESFIKGTDGDVGAPAADDAFVSGSISRGGDSGPGSRAPAIGGGWDFAQHRYAAFRYKGDYPNKDKYADLGTSATLAATPVSGTSCDCAPEESSGRKRLQNDIAWTALWCAGVASDLDSEILEPTATPWNKVDDDRLKGEFAIMDEGMAKVPGANTAYASCNQAACAVLAAVVDMDMSPYQAASGNPWHMAHWCQAHPEYWEKVNATKTADLQPGDVLVVWQEEDDQASPCHTAIWVGNDLVRTRFPNSSATVYQAGYQEGDHARYPQMDVLDDWGFEVMEYTVFRVRKANTSSEWGTVDYKSILSQTMGASYVYKPF